MRRRDFFKGSLVSSMVMAGLALPGMLFAGSKTGLKTSQDKRKPILRRGTWPTVPMPKFQVADGLFEPNWESLRKYYKCPDWFRDAKLGFWSHWGPQSQSGGGDWYTRNLYIQGHNAYKHHLEKYGHPTKHGAKDMICAWKAEKWDPEALIKLYKEAGAKYFVHMANHHDNFDSWDSKYQPWNSVNVGPKKDITKRWADSARKHGLKFGVTFHSSPDRVWNNFMPAWYGSDTKGPLKGIPYDGAVVTKADGKGTEWEGLDPRDLYGPVHKANEPCPEMVRQYLLRIDDLLQKVRPDLLYFDTAIYHLRDKLERIRLDAFMGIPDICTQIAAHYYNLNMDWNNGKMEAVLNLKGVADNEVTREFLSSSVVNDFEWIDPDKPFEHPWQTDTSIGNWHYHENDDYRPVEEMVHVLVNIVSNNGCMLLNIPLPGSGEPDEGQMKFIRDFGSWMRVNGEAIYATRPWIKTSENLDSSSKAMSPPEKKNRVNFSRSKDGNTIYAISLAWPDEGRLLIRSLGSSQKEMRKISEIRLLGYNGRIQWQQETNGLHIDLPDSKPCKHAWSFVINH